MILEGFTAFVLSYLGVAWLRQWAVKHQILDIPNERSLHSVATPRGGGLAIVLVTLVGLVLDRLLVPVLGWSGRWAYALGAGLIAFVSLVDDLRTVPWSVRLMVHCLAALLLVYGAGYWDWLAVPFIGPQYLGWLGLPLTALWVVGLTNAFNFMDGIDGLAAGQAVIAGCTWFLLGVCVLIQPVVASLALLLAASSLGFLLHNMPPARIFMGDVGSTFLGYSFGALPVLASSDVSDPRLALVSIAISAPLVFDTMLTLVRRAIHREELFEAHQSHLYQRLVRLGYSHGQVTALYGALAVLSAISGYMYLRSCRDALALLGGLAVLGILTALQLRVSVIERR
jgi:UDP-N-acetylmuramyl pentapeptide phosphotransferase/UDP-N-acetylglucosamine-1-phosphate transferase